MNRPALLPVLSAVAAAILVGAGVAALESPAGAAEPRSSVAAVEGCAVQGADLDWGLKESFRAYIDGSIANGEWTVADGAVYATPLFGWRAGSGSVDPSRSSGTVVFAGSVRFTGHEGILDTTIANPVLRLDDADTATLLLDVSGDTMEGDPISAVGQEFVTIDLSGADLSPHDGLIVVEDAPTVLTADGSVAFPNYPAGTAFDAISFTLPVGDCALRAPARGPGALGIAAIAIGGLAIVVAGVWVVLRIRRRA